MHPSKGGGEGKGGRASLSVIWHPGKHTRTSLFEKSRNALEALLRKRKPLFGSRVRHVSKEFLRTRKGVGAWGGVRGGGREVEVVGYREIRQTSLKKST